MVYAKVGYKVICFLLEFEPGQVFLTEIIESLDASRGFVSDLTFCMHQAARREDGGLLSSRPQFLGKMVALAFSWLGLLTESAQGQAILEKTRFYEAMADLITPEGHFDHVLLQLFHSFDMSQVWARPPHVAIFELALARGSLHLAERGMELIRLCLPSEFKNFKGWAIRQLMHILEAGRAVLKALQVLE
jgi:hypothetical protein